MLRISESKNGLVQRDLASVLTIEESTLTRLLDRMEADGLVRRMPSSQDRREICVTLTVEAFLDALQIGIELLFFRHEIDRHHAPGRSAAQAAS